MLHSVHVQLLFTRSFAFNAVWRERSKGLKPNQNASSHLSISLKLQTCNNILRFENVTVMVEVDRFKCSTQLLVSVCVYPLNLYSILVFTFPAFMIPLFRIQEIKIPPGIHPIPHLLFCYLIFPSVILDGNQDAVKLNKCLSPPSCHVFIQEYNRIKQCITYTLLILISKIHRQ